jgi:hypothetical protein
MLHHLLLVSVGLEQFFQRICVDYSSRVFYIIGYKKSSEVYQKNQIREKQNDCVDRRKKKKKNRCEMKKAKKKIKRQNLKKNKRICTKNRTTKIKKMHCLHRNLFFNAVDKDRIHFR